MDYEHLCCLSLLSPTLDSFPLSSHPPFSPPPPPLASPPPITPSPAPHTSLVGREESQAEGVAKQETKEINQIVHLQIIEILNKTIIN